MPTLSWRHTFETVLTGEAISSAFSDGVRLGRLHPSDCAEDIFQKIYNPPRATMPFSMSVGRRESNLIQIARPGAAVPLSPRSDQQPLPSPLPSCHCRGPSSLQKFEVCAGIT